MTDADWNGARGEKWLAGLAGMEATLAPIDEPLVRALGLDAPYRIAEVASGGGATTQSILRHAPLGSIVDGFDISPALVEYAHRRVPRATFHVADMNIAAPPEVPYDRLVARFGVMFFADEQRGFTNLARWLAPGGRFAFAVWGPPRDNPWISEAREVVERFVDVPVPDPDAPGPFRYADVAKLIAVLEQGGFTDVHAADWRGALPVGGGVPAADAATFALASLSTFAELLAAAGDEVAAEAHAAMTTMLAKHERDGAVWMHACVRIVTGSRA